MRPTGEVVIIILTVGISATMMIVSAGLVVLTILDPTRDLATAVEAVSRLITIAIGVVVGYLAGIRPHRRGD